MELVSAQRRGLTRHRGGKTGAGHRHQPGMTQHQTDPVGPDTGPPAGPCLRPGPPVDVRTWRRCRLLEAGFPEELATRLAGTPRVDLHALLQLVDRGCPPQLAARVLAPLDAGERA